MKKSILSILLIIFMCLSFFSCGGKEKTTDVITAEIVVKDYGSIIVDLDYDSAPITVYHFVKLAKAGSYDNSYFNRMQAGFVLQGGAGASDNSTIKGEFTSNGVNNPLKHEKGTISMARSSVSTKDTPANDSASSQFFIMLDKNTTLDGSYAAFGHVTSGWDVVEAICADVESTDLSDTTYCFFKEDAYVYIETIKITGNAADPEDTSSTDNTVTIFLVVLGALVLGAIVFMVLWQGEDEKKRKAKAKEKAKMNALRSQNQKKNKR